MAQKKVQRKFFAEDELYKKIPLPNRSGWIRDAIRQKLATDSNITKDTNQELHNLNHELRKIGVNINQMARNANQGRPVTFKIEDKGSYSKLLRTINSQLNSILRKL